MFEMTVKPEDHNENLILNAMLYNFDDNNENLKVINNDLSLVNDANKSNISVIKKIDNETNKHRKPFFIHIKIWNEYRKSFPWLYYSEKNFFCSYCQNAYKLDAGLTMSAWISGKTVENNKNNNRKSCNYKRSRFEKHCESRNHIIAVECLTNEKFENKIIFENYDQNKIKNKDNFEKNDSKNIHDCKKSEYNEQIIKNFLSDVHNSPHDFVKRSRKSAPYKVYRRPNVILPVSISSQQYITLKSRFSWLLSSSETSFLCEICRNSNNSIDFDRDSTLSLISRRILSHSHSEAHIRNTKCDIDYLSCPQCKSQFSLHRSLIEHISLCDYQSTDTDRQLSCPCSNVQHFNTITKIDLHAAQEHSQQQLFHCYICSEKCSRMLTLYDHMLTVHLIDWDPFEAFSPLDTIVSLLECIFCSKFYNTNIELTNHYCCSPCNKYLQPIVLLDQTVIKNDKLWNKNSESLSEKEKFVPSIKLHKKRFHKSFLYRKPIELNGIENKEDLKENCFEDAMKNKPEELNYRNINKIVVSMNVNRRRVCKSVYNRKSIEINEIANKEDIKESVDKIKGNKRNEINLSVKLSKNRGRKKITSSISINETQSDGIHTDIHSNEQIEKETNKFDLLEKRYDKSIFKCLPSSESLKMKIIQTGVELLLKEPEEVAAKEKFINEGNVNELLMESIRKSLLSEVSTTNIDENEKKMVPNMSVIALESLVEKNDNLINYENTHEKASMNMFRKNLFSTLSEIVASNDCEYLENIHTEKISSESDVLFNKVIKTVDERTILPEILKSVEEKIDIDETVNDNHNTNLQKLSSNKDRKGLFSLKLSEIGVADNENVINNNQIIEEFNNNIKSMDKVQLDELNEDENANKITESNGLTVCEEKINMEKKSRKSRVSKKLEVSLDSLTYSNKLKRIRNPPEKLREDIGYTEHKKRVRVSSEKLVDNLESNDDKKRRRFPPKKLLEIEEKMPLEKKKRNRISTNKKIEKAESLNDKSPIKETEKIKENTDSRQSSLENIIKHITVNKSVKFRRHSPINKLRTINDLAARKRIRIEQIERKIKTKARLESRIMSQIKPHKLPHRLKKSMNILEKYENQNNMKPKIVKNKVKSNEIINVNPLLNREELHKKTSSINTDTEVDKSLINVKRLQKPVMMIKSQLSPPGKILVNIGQDKDCIPMELSFMDRMKKIRQLKKIRTEQQREQMMEVDRIVGEINENSFRGESLLVKSDEIKKLLNSEQYSMADLKHILHQESAKKRKKTSDVSNDCKSTKKSKLESMVLGQKSEIFGCELCQLKFNSLRHRDKHLTAEHKGTRLFKCNICNMSVSTYFGLRNHALKYHSDNVGLSVYGKENHIDIHFSFQCHYCSMQFTSKSGMNHHITSIHRTNTEKNHKSISKSVANVESSVVVDDFLYKLIKADPLSCCLECTTCNEKLFNEFEMTIHTIEHEQENDTNVSGNQFACPKCCRLFFGPEGKTYLKDHYNIVHLQKPLPSCEECNMLFPSTWCYYDHKKTTKNCAKKNPEQLVSPIDPYEQLNDPLRVAFVCSRCQTLVAGEFAEKRFADHQHECSQRLYGDDENEEVL